MDSNERNELDDLQPEHSLESSPQVPRRNHRQLLSKIFVQLTLEVGATTISLTELMNIEDGSVLELDRLAGEPLLVKINGTIVGHAEVVVAGENYGLRIIDLEQIGDFTP
ncbi:flagellar motor switch protein FliN [Pandoraea apista]|uniref:flagellar motor switch protein FliN n=1 Tax=Pandoraea apista TaxID=93218 RepID=UPI000F682504|nr:flagellar motor switch protein FliN [Pandoraea apista]RRW88799.1 flagellar motor switch protein FliN [Pandoraea apista]RRW98058.1 flagellar motor switch protein FliN [Pandoraea apista]